MMEQSIKYTTPLRFDYVSPPILTTSHAPKNKGAQTRKQNHSCDQCRRGKRRCDANVEKLSRIEEKGSQLRNEALEPCGYCVRTRKTCTYEWLLSQTSNKATPFNAGHKVEEVSEVSVVGDDYNYQPFPSGLDSLPPNLLDFNDNSTSDSSNSRGSSFSLSENGYPPIEADCDAFDELTRVNSNPKRSLVDIDSFETDVNHEKDASNQLLHFNNRSTPFSLSLDSLPARIAITTNTTLLSNSLFRIYHDSMENALSCWLNERTCPYKQSFSTALDFQPATSQSLQRAWAPSAWSNRIFQRVCALDSVSGRFRERPMTKSENASASKALYLVIMAFAAQWAQASKRSREQHSPMTTSDTFNDYRTENREYDRIVQEEYWHAARRALLGCADVESFKVAFANILFSLVQKPIPKEAQEALRNSTSKSLTEDVARILSAEGPPIYLEQGVRHAHNLRHKLYKKEREQAALNSGIDSTLTILSPEDRTTVDMIAWLGYMLESLTSALHERPLVVSDEDTDVLPDSFAAISLSDSPNNPESELSKVSPTDLPSRLWTDYFFLQERHNRSSAAPLRYPCTYAEAAVGLTDAAPIKVLLYRKIITLQSLVARHAPAYKVEAVIAEALHVYRHWTTHYEPFVLDCINHHEELQARIQSWYICLTAHWHLAALTLIHILEQIDSTLPNPHPLCGKSEAQARNNTRLIARLRSHNAHMAAHLARVSTPSSSSYIESDLQRTMHFAMSAGALLTEPWTELLVRVFAAGAIVLVREADEKSGEEAKQAARRADECVRALKYLGKKSDSARLVGEACGRAVMRRWMVLNGEDGGGYESGEDWNGVGSGNGLDRMAEQFLEQPFELKIDPSARCDGLGTLNDGFGLGAGYKEFSFL